MSEASYYPLSRSQTFIYSCMSYCPPIRAFNLCSEIEFLEEIDRKLMLQAMVLSFMRNPCCSTRIHIASDRNPCQYFSELPPEGVEFLDFSNLTDEGYETELRKLAAEDFPNHCRDTQLYRIKLLRKPNGNYALFLLCSHLICDAYGLVSLYRGVCCVYAALVAGSPLPDAPLSPVPLYENERIVESNPEKIELARKYYEEMYPDEPQNTFINGKDGRCFSKKTKYVKYPFSSKPGDSIQLPIPAKLHQAVSVFNDTYKSSSQAVYLLALRSYYAAVCEVDDVSFSNTISLRSTLKEKHTSATIGTLTNIRLKDYANDTFAEGCRKTSRALITGYRHARYGFSVLPTFTLPPRLKWPVMATFVGTVFAYQPHSPFPESLKAKIRHLSTGMESGALYVHVMPCDSEGNMVIDYSYMDAATTVENIKKCHDFMMAFIEKGLQQPDRLLTDLAAEVLK